MEIKNSEISIIIAILAILMLSGGVAIPVSATTPMTSYFTGFSGIIDYGYSTSLSPVTISPSYSNSDFQEFDIKYGYSLPGSTSHIKNNNSGRLGNDNLIAKAMINYHINPPKPIQNPSPDFTLRNFDSVNISFT
jgi:hypothetical protein